MSDICQKSCDVSIRIAMHIICSGPLGLMMLVRVITDILLKDDTLSPLKPSLLCLYPV